MPEQFLIGMFVAMCVGGLITAGVLYYHRIRRAGRDAAAWVHVGNMNTLLRLDLDHLTGNDDNYGLRELRAAFKELSAHRSPGDRKLFEQYNALVGVAIAFGEKVRDDDGVVHMQAVANRRAHVQNALAVGDQIEAALGGIEELARCGQPDRRERMRQIYQRA